MLRKLGDKATTRLKHPDFSPALTRCRRHYSERTGTVPSVELPPPIDWRNIFKTTPVLVRDRISLRNLETATDLAPVLVPDMKDHPAMQRTRENREPEGSVIIEAFPGPGALTRGLMKLPRSRVRRIIVLEDYGQYYDWLKPLEEVDDRVTVVQRSGYFWDTYPILEEMGLLDDVQTYPWEQLHPSLRFIAHVPHNIPGEQLVNQFYRNIPDRAWLYKYGRMPMNLIMGEWLWQRISAPAGSNTRCKLSIIAEALASSSLAVPRDRLLPYDDHFHPTTSKMSPHQEKRPEARRIGHPHVVVNVTPKEHVAIAPGQLEKWDYVLRRLFVLKSTALRSAIGSLAPGAAALIKPIAATGVDIKQPIKKLSLDDWAKIVKVFDEWPFAPEDLLISESFNPDTSRV
ncbi:S-adenosyl-L-methionine-dependent methyltransferase [Punctularia strigosozonata HHB-11173 SS5]|uniref:S-adenosyl-L-methionine-dependent methyltransferase n=1 Tax=Punctularia strigosozonata (strain HHB-11173) TaxID=741275 RepID=UPI0004416A2D|nr:S-adenosyl-L-methionine-dependent methyltransferase [Punctularia strigosozonata HHB-11173 SS5]EIN11868.1 S-adenosyl-L-methionine-dependent methyltransferase [Punctularia strigosozonata HHB-11173 SS5]